MLLLNNSLAARYTLQKRALIFSCCTVLILFVFQPFGTYESELSYKYLRLAGYGLATFFAIFIAGMIEIWLSKKQLNIPFYPQIIIVLYTMIIALLNHSYFVVAIFDRWLWQNQLMFVFYVLAIALFPVTIMYFREARGVKLADINEPGTSAAEEEAGYETRLKYEAITVQITGENKGECLTLDINKTILMKSADNYCEIMTRKGNAVEVHLIRSSLSKVLAQLPENNQIVRCHRSYGVNLSLVKESTGNANGLKLEMQLGETIVPVSRSYVNGVKQALLLAPEKS